MSKQSTLFKAWGGGSKDPAACKQPQKSDVPTPTVRNPVSSAPPADRYEIPDDDFANFFDDDLTDEDLLQSCDGEFATLTTTQDLHVQPSTSGSGNKLHQKTLTLHVGPSHSLLNTSVVEEDIPGFDPEAGELWIYPTNYPVRDYQYNIVQRALFTNTLVCLPTGLGKTFIAAVVMYNFYRWYPNNKIVFLAPTKPLVTQQIEACHGVMGIPQEHAAEMTGNLPPKERVSLWESRRVFFLTPQVMQNDLSRGTCPAHLVCCVVFDEAHKALGNHAYCQVVRGLAQGEGRFRVLALSATPGNDLKAVQQVVTNLQIGHIELRNEDSEDIQRYVHERKVEKIIVPLEGEIADIKNNFLNVLSSVVSRLSRYKVLYHSSVERMSKYQMLHARDQFRQNGSSCPTGVMVHPGVIESDFALGISLYHAYELLLQHGMRSFHQFLTTTFTEGSQQSRAKMEVLRTSDFVEILRVLGNNLGREGEGIDRTDGCRSARHSNNKHISPRFSITGAPQAAVQRPFFYSHPKLNKLEEVVLDHFRKFKEQVPIDLTGPSSKRPAVNTRVMIFSQYRESVQEISELLTRHSPLVRVMTFVGHSSGKSTSKGLTQKEQTVIVRKFREGGYNTLVATCVGEEGLDIGEVDLIVCFDAAKSPIRLVQRMGRTGRKRDGRIVVIVAEGKEDQIYNKSQSNKRSIHRAIKEGCRNLVFFDRCPRMVPRYILPQVHKMQMTIGEFVSSKQGKRTVTSKTGVSKSSLSGGCQSKLGFGVNKRKGDKHGFLNSDELSCWSNELAVSDREFRTLEKSVENCFPTQTDFLSIAKLKEGVDSKCHKSSQRNSFVDLSTSFANSSLNSSASQLRRKYHLSLNKWTPYQTAPIPSAITGHSSKTKQLTSVLEFIDLLNSTDGVGHSYDLEMETFLNMEDVQKRERHDQQQESVQSAALSPDGGSVNVGVRKKRKVSRVQRFLDESSDEDAGQSEKLVAETFNDTDAVIVHVGHFESTADGVVNEAGACVDVANEEVDGEPGEVSCEKQEEVDAMLTAFQASQHVVPRAPSLDSLDWLDEIEPSQVQNSVMKKDGDRSSSAQVGSSLAESLSKREEEFQFVTPKAPPSSRRRSLVQASSTPISFSKQRRKRILSPVDEKLFRESIDTFDDLPANAIFDDFSDTMSSKAEVTEAKHSTGNRPSNSISEIGETKQMSLCETSKLMENCVVIDSDSEGEEDGERGIQKRDKLSAAAQDTSCTSEDSFLQVHGRRRKKTCKVINHVLESPPTQHSPAAFPNKPRYNLSPGSKENVPSQALVGMDTTKWLSTKRARTKNVKKKVTRFDLSDSSDDDDFNEPLMQRIRKKALSKKSTSSIGIQKSPEGKKAQRKVSPRRLEGFVEEEADVSFGEGEESTDESSQLLQDSREYDMEDSFINDNSMLTQVSPSQRERGKSKRCRSSASGQGNMYLQSLMSPENHLFGGRKGKVGGFKMVLSQRHQILNHYIKKAGFNVAESAVKRSRQSGRRRMRSDSDLESEAEEVNFRYGEEDLAELSHSQSLAEVTATDQSSRTSSSVGDVAEDKTPMVLSRKRRPGFLSDSDHDVSLPPCDRAARTTGSKRLRLSDCSFSSERDAVQCSCSSAVALAQASSSSKTPSTINRVVISPSLLASITIKKTAPCFSLGMEDWLTDMDNYLFAESSSHVNEPEECVASESLLLSQEDIYQLGEDFQDSDTELL